MRLTRRRIVFGLAPAGAFAAAPRPAEAAQRSSEATAIERQTLEELRDLVRQVRAQGDPPVLATIREAQRTFLRANQRYPEYIEIGITVWEQLYDWHVHTGQQLQLTRLDDGRYAMGTLMSTLVLHVGAPAT